MGFWPLVSMGAILGGTMRSPLTGILFAIELTHDFNMLLPLVVASFLAHGFTVLTLKRSILTEKIARRGFHLTREYAVDPLEILFVREVMRTNVVALPIGATFGEAHDLVRPGRKPHGQHLFPIVDKDEHLAAVISRSDLLKSLEQGHSRREILSSITSGYPTVAFADESLRAIVYRMAESGFTRLPVVDRAEKERLIGMVALADLLRARSRHLEEERTKERVFHLRLPLRQRKSEDGAASRRA
jgi:CBS domain-containing protein